VDFYEPTAQQWDEDLRELRIRLFGALAFLLSVTAVGTLGFKVIDPSAGWIRAFFMTAITLTTVGYGEEIPVDTDGARIFTAVLILVGMGGVLYFVSASTAFILEGQLGHVFRRRRMERKLAGLRNHLIVCGSGQTAFYAAAELASVQRPVVLIVADEDGGVRARAELENVPIIVGDATDDHVLISAGIEHAAGVVACSGSDNENVVTTLTARHINPSVRIVSRVQDVDNESKIRKVGADAVVSPQFTGGLRMASELVRPTVVTFLDTMLRDEELNLRIEEIDVPEGSPSVGKPLSEIGLEKAPRALLVATRGPDGQWEYNPERSAVVRAGTVLIFLGSPGDVRTLCGHIEG
jgi:voltage-gated potassium channel